VGYGVDRRGKGEEAEDARYWGANKRQVVPSKKIEKQSGGELRARHGTSQGKPRNTARGLLLNKKDRRKPRKERNGNVSEFLTSAGLSGGGGMEE